MRYIIAARYNDKGERIFENEKEKLVLDSQMAREIVAGLNSRTETGAILREVMKSGEGQGA